MSSKSCPRFFHPLAAMETRSDGQCFANAFAVAEHRVNLALTGALLPDLNVVKILRQTGFDRLHIQAMFEDARQGNHHARLRMIEFTADALVEEEGLEANALEDDADDQISMTPG
ncbi:MAG: hypothetical protein OXF25_04570 [Cyanobacteria bacterium MAG CAR3_bin_5]|nr:hypothetical protein [Cyanobacteria bacterium MAG CAR4_bin_6]MCY4173330.1 hypothetical protein [Cyanobacteria bacterium MAG CAR3_bin_5]MCY4236297.1 hypothetical protein [Cyanobacteria bacterium MAG CAR2_bin_4]MCY4332816.1 hypothetical protein [Cyanobacteria bacterium MAG CAR1_bin_15]